MSAPQEQIFLSLALPQLLGEFPECRKDSIIRQTMSLFAEFLIAAAAPCRWPRVPIIQWPEEGLMSSMNQYFNIRGFLMVTGVQGESHPKF